MARKQDDARQVYDAVKGDHVFVMSPSMVKELKNGAYSNVAYRQAFWEAALLGDSDLSQEYQNFVCQSTKGSIENRMGVFPGIFDGMRLLVLGSVGDCSLAGSSNGLYDFGGRVLGGSAGGAVVRAGGTDAQDKPGESLEGKLVITPGEEFVHRGLTYREHQGVYLPVLPQD